MRGRLVPTPLEYTTGPDRSNLRLILALTTAFHTIPVPASARERTWQLVLQAAPVVADAAAMTPANPGSAGVISGVTAHPLPSAVAAGGRGGEGEA